MNEQLDKEGSLKVLKDIFSAHAERTHDTYSLSCGYYLLTGRNGWVVITDENEEAFVPLCVNPNNRSQILVFPEIASTVKRANYNLTERVLSHLYWQGQRDNVLMARFTVDEYARLKYSLNRAGAIDLTLDDDFYINNTPSTEVLDWRFPIHNLSTEMYAHLNAPEKLGKIGFTGKKVSELRRKVNKARTALANNDTRELSLSKPQDRDEFISHTKECITDWLKHKRQSQPEFSDNFYDELPQVLEENHNIFGGVLIVSNNKAVGFSIWDITDDTANSLASLYTGDIPEMARYLNARSCEILHERGVKKYNIGGSEDPTMDRTKRECVPKESQRIYSYQIVFKKAPPPFTGTIDCSSVINNLRPEEATQRTPPRSLNMPVHCNTYPA